MILVRGKIDSAFFNDLSCGLEASTATVALLDFNKGTADADWFKEGRRYFDDERFTLAEVGSLWLAFVLSNSTSLT